MTATERLGLHAAPMADPAARAGRRNDGEWRIWLGWAAAAMLHGGLLAALIFSWPAKLSPAPPNSAAISLLIVAAQQSGRQPAVQPKPPEAHVTLPAAPPVKIANGAAQPTPRATLPKAATHASSAKAVSAAPHVGVETKTVPQQLGGGFIAAQPEAGNNNQPPEYPALARAYNEQGDVLLSIHVLASGRADSVSVTQSSGYKILDDAAAKAVWNWRFQPSTLSGQPVPSVIPYRIHFNLQDAN